MGEFLMPSLGADMERGTVVEWRVGPGDVVHRGDIVAVVDTEKSTIEVEVFEAGTIGELLVEPGVEVPVGTPLATIVPTGAATTPTAGAPRAEVREPAKEPAKEPAPAAPAGGHHAVTSPLVRHLAEELGVDTDRVDGTGAGAAVTRADVEAAAARRPSAPPSTRREATARGEQGPLPGPPPAVSAGGGRVRASPLARRRAAAAGVDLTTVPGTGPEGAVVARDVHAPGAATPGPPEVRPEGRGAPAGPADRLDTLRRSVAALMTRSKREIPHFYLATTIDLGAAVAWLEDLNHDRPPATRVVPAALLLRATVLAAREVPVLNGHWVDGELRPADRVHLGVAISLRGGGLIAPAVRDADALGVDEVMARLRDLTARARRGVLRASEMTDPSITVTNLGDLGVESVYGVIYPPQVAMVGFGRVVERPWAVEGALTVRPVVTATLAADHRAANGHEGARFLAAVDRALQRPEEL